MSPRVSRRDDMRAVVKVATPLYLSMIVVTLGALVNTAVLGRYDTSALAAFALTGGVYFPATAAVSGTVRGMMPFVTSNAESPDDLSRTIRSGAWLAVVVGIVGGLAVLCVRPLAAATGVPESTSDALGAFPILMAAGVVVTSIGAMSTSTLVGLKRSKVVLYAGIGGALCIVVLSTTLVQGRGPFPELGLEGSGVALLTANSTIAIVTLIGLRRELDAPLWSFMVGQARFREMIEMAKVGVPMAGTVLVKFGVLGVLAIAASRISTDAGAAHGIATGIVGLTFTAAVAVGQATIPLVTPSAARGDRAGATRAVVAGLFVVILVLGTLCLCVLVFRSSIASAFTADPDVRAIVIGLLPLVAASVVADGIQATWGFGLTGLKRTLPSFVVFAIVYGTLGLLSNQIATSSGLNGLWAALLAANIAVAIGQAAAFRSQAANLPIRRL